MEIFFIPLVYILLICLLIGNHRFFDLKGVSRAFVCILFIIKAFAGIIITFNAEKIYGGDERKAEKDLVAKGWLSAVEAASLKTLELDVEMEAFW